MTARWLAIVGICCASPAAGKSTSALVFTGEASVRANARDLARTRRRAISAAKRNAGQRAVEALAGSNLAPEKARVIAAALLNRIDRYVRTYRVLNQSSAGNRLNVQIEVVFRRSFRRRLAKLVGSTAPVAQAAVGVWGDQRDAIATILAGRGFAVVRVEQPDLKAALAFARKRRCARLIVGAIVLQKANGVRGLTLAAARASATLRVLDPATGLSQASQQSQAVGVADVVEQARSAAAAKATRKAVAALTSGWTRQRGMRTGVVLTMEGGRLSQIDRVCGRLKRSILRLRHCVPWRIHGTNVALRVEGATIDAVIRAVAQPFARFALRLRQRQGDRVAFSVAAVEPVQP